jgi:Domain of unknown function (DUF5753)
MIDLYKSCGAPVSDETRADLLRLSKEARRRGWWVGYGLEESFALYVGLETEAAAVHNYHEGLVHGLLQTEAYARAVRLAGLPSPTPDELDRWLTVRMRRQDRLTAEEPLSLWAIMSEGVLRKEVGGAAVMADQLRALIGRAELSNVTIQVMPFKAGAHPAGDSTFTLLTFRERFDLPTVYLETPTENLYLEDPDDVDWHRVALDHLRAMALPPAESVAMIQSIIQELESRVDG